MFGRKSARIAEQDAEIAELAYQLHKEEERANRIAGRLAATEGQLAAARIERDGYREDALKYRRARANLIPGGPYRGKGSKPKPNGAAVQGVV